MNPVAEWENEGKENADGLFVARIDTGDGRGVQRFEGKTHKDVADKLMAAQLSATQKISDLDSQVRNSRKPVKEKPIVAPEVKFSGDERVKIASDLQNPATAPDAIKKVVETVRNAEHSVDQQQEDRRKAEVAAALQFRKEQPEYFFCDFNARAVSQYFKLHNLDRAEVANYHIAFDELKAAGLVQMAPATPTAEPVPAPATPTREPERIVPPQPRARGSQVSSGLRAEHSSGSPPPPAPKTKLTRYDIEVMPEKEYAEKYRNEPEFRRIVDQLYEQPQRAAASR